MNTSVSFSVWTRDAWNVLLHDIQNAHKSIDIEQYIFSIDSAGQKFLTALIEKAQQGVKIRLLVDAVGSFTMYQSGVPDLLRSHGIVVRIYNPISPWRITNFTSNFWRDHRKLAIIDGEIAHLGGVGIQASMEDWRDTHMRITGETVADITAAFERVWKNVSAARLLPFRREKQIPKLFNILTNGPRPGQRYIYRTLIARLRFAQNYIYLSTPYFVPDARLLRVLKTARRRGVDVRLLVPAVADAPFVDHAGGFYFASLLKVGVKIYRYKAIMMHAKTAIIDDAWATAGSFNLDNLSFLFNNEINISSTDPSFVSILKQHFLEDIQASEELQYGEWIKRPFLKKFLEFITWPIHGIM